MHAQDIISLARKQAHTSDSLINNDEALGLLNIVYQDCIRTIKDSVGEEFLFQEWEISTVAWENAYPFDKATAWVDGIDKIVNVRVKYRESDTHYTIVKPGTIQSLEKDEAYYQEFQSELSPFFLVQNEVLKIYPAPKESITDGLVVGSLMWVKDLTLSTVESDILVRREFHSTLIHGLMMYFFQRRWLTNDEEFYKQRYKQEKREMVRSMSDIVESPIKVQLPDLSYYD